MLKWEVHCFSKKEKKKKKKKYTGSQVWHESLMVVGEAVKVVLKWHVQCAQNTMGKS